MLIRHPRQGAEDIRRWEELERADAVHAQTGAFARRVERSLAALRDFVRAGPCYVGVSWGKDSVVVAHLAWRLYAEGLRPPVIWFPAGPIENPDCVLVRDAFLARWPVDYREVEAVEPVLHMDWEGHDGFQAAFERVSRSVCRRYVSGVRAEESSARRRRCARWGESSPNTCAPLARWTAADVFAYAHLHELPLHPAYGCLMGGVLERGVIRVGTIGGKRGIGWGRREWERRYYGSELAAIEATRRRR